MTGQIFKKMSKPPKPTRIVKTLSNLDGLEVTHGPRCKDALGRDIEPEWAAVQNAKGERVYIKGGGG